MFLQGVALRFDLCDFLFDFGFCHNSPLSEFFVVAAVVKFGIQSGGV